MSNNESFLKMIGLDKEFDTPKEEASSASQTASDSWGALMPESSWDVPAEAPSAEATPIEVVQVEQSAVESSDSGTEWNLEKTESYKEEELSASLTEPSTEKTAVYSELEMSRLSDNRVRTQTQSKAMTLSQALASTTGTGTMPLQTRKTVPFNEGDGTAHFDYSAQRSDHRIVLLEGKASAQAFHLGNLPLRIGREPQNEVVLDDVNASRFHAEIREENGELVVVDLGSTNGVKVNGELVPQKALSSHDVIQVGDCLFEFLPPGVLSKGVPQAAVFSAPGEASAKFVSPSSRRRKILIAAASAIVAVLGYFLVVGGGERAAETVKQMAAEKAKEELETIRSELEKKAQRPISELNPDDVKQAFLDHVKDSSLMKLLPLDAQTQLTNLPPEILQIFVQDPSLLSDVVSQGADQSAVARVLKSRISDLVVQKRHVDALGMAELLLKITPEDAGLKEARDRLAALVSAKSQDESGYTEAEKKFFEYMEQHENFVMKLMDEKRLDDAARFSDVVSKNIGVLIEQDKSFEKVGLEEKEKWEQRARDLRSKIDERDAKSKATAKVQSEGSEMVAQIKNHLNFGEVGKANAIIAKFLEEFPQHPQAGEVVGLKAQLEAAVDRSFESTRSAIEQLVETESFENAWKELYRFVDLMPTHGHVKSLRELIEKKAGGKAVQYYNQARVYEYEADDLVAAEQYYKRTLEIADPRSDLAKKAGRRYAEVKQRTIQ